MLPSPNREKLIKMLLVLAGILLAVGFLSHLRKKSSLSLSDYAGQHPEWYEGEETSAESTSDDAQPEGNAGSGAQPDTSGTGETVPDNADDAPPESGGTDDGSDPDTAPLTGELLNGDSMLSFRAVYRDSFYYEPLSDPLKDHIRGVSVPQDDDCEQLVYAHILYNDPEGTARRGELICSADAAKDLVEIFYELYRNDYRFSGIGLIEEYDGSVQTAMAENFSFCLASSEGMSDGLCMVINPLYNPLISYDAQGGQTVMPEEGSPYADRSLSFAYKIDDDDLCHKLFLQHGFVWGGNGNTAKKYGMFTLIKPARE